MGAHLPCTQGVVGSSPIWSTMEKKKFEEKLRLFGVKVGIICALENGGKFTEEEAFKQIKKLYKKLKKHKKKSPNDTKAPPEIGGDQPPAQQGDADS